MEKSRAEKKYELMVSAETKQKYVELKTKFEKMGIKSKEDLKIKLSKNEISNEDHNEYKEYKRMEKIYENLPMVESLLEARKKIESLREAIIEELNSRQTIDDENKKIDKQNKKKETERQKLDKELEEIMKEENQIKKELKNDKLTDKERKDLEKRLKTNQEKRRKNNEKFSQNVDTAKKDFNDKSLLANMSEEELKDNAIMLKTKMSRYDLYILDLLKGRSLENAKEHEQSINWDDKSKKSEYAKELNEEVKRYTSSKENREKITQLKDILKVKAERDSALKLEKAPKKDETTSMVEVSEFDQKHPKIAALKNWFKKIAQKITTKTEKADKDIDEEDLKKIEEGLEKNLEEQIKLPEESKRKSFIKDLKFFEGADISKIAESGYKEVQKQEQTASKVSAIERLIAEKKEAGEGKDGGSIAKLEAKLDAMKGKDKGEDR